MNPTEAEATSRTTPLKTEAGEAYLPKSEANEAYPPKSDASKTFPAKSEATETSPLTNDPRQNTYPEQLRSAGQTFRSTYFIISIALTAVIPIVQVTIGAIYEGDCPMNQYIVTYMIVAGSVGLVLVALSLLLALTFRCLFADSESMSMVACGGICCTLSLTIILLIFSFTWWIIGCVWVFTATDHVEFTHPMKPNYCQPVLYQAAFVILIITPIWCIIQSFATCLRFCFTLTSVA